MKAIFTLYVVISLATIAQTINYCSKDLCAPGKRHIGCNNRKSFRPTCPGNAKMVDLRQFQKNILQIHNNYRNQIAGGGLRGYKPAVRMATMQWDNELAALAALNVKQCTMKHDQCRNTVKFKTAGQNLAMFTYTGPIKSRSNLSLIRNRVNAWWRENKNANMNIINSYPKSYSGAAIGHFTVFVRDSNPRIGCAASRFSNGKKNRFLIACNYATTNLGGNPVYVAGRAASGCKTGRNATYKNLCSIKEVYADL